MDEGLALGPSHFFVQYAQMHKACINMHFRPAAGARRLRRRAALHFNALKHKSAVDKGKSELPQKVPENGYFAQFSEPVFRRF